MTQSRSIVSTHIKRTKTMHKKVVVQDLYSFQCIINLQMIYVDLFKFHTKFMTNKTHSK